MKIGLAIESRTRCLGVLPVLGVAIATAVFVFGSISIWFPVLVGVLAVVIWPVSVTYAIRHGPTAGLSSEDAARVPIAYLPWFGVSTEPGAAAGEDPEASDQ